jgi:hypothetical protein
MLNLVNKLNYIYIIIMDKPLYKPFKSTAKNKKYSVYVMKNGKKRLIHFGDKRYGQFKDKIGEYSKLDHNDPKRRKAYYSRHGKAKDKNTAKYWSHKILW